MARRCLERSVSLWQGMAGRLGSARQVGSGIRYVRRGMAGRQVAVGRSLLLRVMNWRARVRLECKSRRGGSRTFRRVKAGRLGTERCGTVGHVLSGLEIRYKKFRGLWAHILSYIGGCQSHLRRGVAGRQVIARLGAIRYARLRLDQFILLTNTNYRGGGLGESIKL
ncbi:hypothetical protein LCGC14_0516720 [marine sediment metagenome]|uniref:Uncharacterized protein n=1 Tax=marine sediment metagenome TaxID=412755 RepID=A0A0F9S4K1_9ZZZZ